MFFGCNCQLRPREMYTITSKKNLGFYDKFQTELYFYEMSYKLKKQIQQGIGKPFETYANRYNIKNNS